MKSLCLPHAWLEHFKDLALVAVLAAHRDAESERGAYIALTELQCAAHTHLNRKTVHKKKTELISERVLLPKPGAGRGWQGLPCLIDWARLTQLTENGQLNWPETDIQLPQNGHSIVQKGTINRPERDNQLPENGQSTDPKGTIELSALNKKHAPAPASIDKNRLEQSIERLRSAKKSDYDPETFKSARDALHSFQAKHSRPENRIATPPDDDITAQFLSVADWPSLQKMIADLEADRTEAGFKWVWFVRVALQRMQGLSPAQWGIVCEQVWPARTPLDRKPVERAESNDAGDSIAKLQAMGYLKKGAHA